MGINHFIRVLLITAIPFLFAASCNKEGTRPCTRTAYYFAVTSVWSPQQEIYHVGDTIFLISTFPKILTDLTGNYPVDYSNSTGIVGDIGFSILDSAGKQALPAKDSFEFVSVSGNFVNRTINQSQGINSRYQETPANYQFKGGIICKKKGTYWVGTDGLQSNGIAGKNCTNAAFQMNVTNSEKHEWLYQNALNITVTPQALGMMYCFRVQ